MIIFSIKLYLNKFDKQVNIFYNNNIKEIETLKTRYEIAITGTRDGLWDWNLITGEIYFSSQWKKQLGYKEDELKNELKTWEDHVHPDDKERAVKDFAANMAGETEVYENKHRLKHKDGSWVWILDRGKTIFDENGKAIRMVGFHTDITKMKKLEFELKEQTEIMIAQSKHAAMGEMISMIAHQWRQPLSVISMGANNIMADVELDMVENDSLKDISQEIINQTQELSNTIDDFKEFFKPFKDSETILIESVFDNAFNVIGKSLKNNNINVIKDCNSKKEIETYSRELMQVFINIIKNAKEILVEKNIKNRKIKIITQDHQEHIIIKIIDNGGGIPTEIIPKIFDPYFSTKNKKTGTGLGLYMSKTIIDKHLQGDIKVMNTSDGACFVIRLPYIIKKDVGGGRNRCINL